MNIYFAPTILTPYKYKSIFVNASCFEAFLPFAFMTIPNIDCQNNCYKIDIHASSLIKKMFGFGRFVHYSTRFLL